MYKQIKQLADEAIALQNKNRMDEVLREISACCERAIRAQLVQNEIALAEGPASGFGLSNLAAKLADAKPGDVVLPDGDETKVTPAETVKNETPADFPVRTRQLKPAAKKGGAK